MVCGLTNQDVIPYMSQFYFAKNTNFNKATLSLYILYPARTCASWGYVINVIHRYIRECGSTLYVGLARAVPPTNTNFRLTFLLTQLRRLSMKTYLDRASNLKSTITFLAFVS